MSDAEAMLARANRDFAEGRFADAAKGFRSLLQSHPDVAELHINLGAALRGAGDGAGAEAAYRAALRLAPENALAWFNLGNLLAERDRTAEATDALDRADALQPGTPEILNNLGVQRYRAGDIAGALDCYDRALAVRPDHADARANRGNALQRLGRMDDARDALEAALAAQPDNPVFRLNMAAYLAAAGAHPAALTWAERAIAADPGYIEAHLKKASLLIQQGHFRAGFALYERRFERPGWHTLADALPMPRWRGEEIAGRRLLVWNEQGFGDALMYARYLPLLAERGAVVVLMCEPPLRRLMRRSFPGIEVVDLGGPAPAADRHVSMMSLPHLLATTPETIPARVPYLAADPGEVAAWRDEIAERTGDDLAVGLVWAGNAGQAHDYARSMPPETARPLLDVPGARVFNLLVGPRGDDWRDPGLIDVRPRLRDFADTAALMASLDLVISVDSAPAHLAGALGRPLWVLLAFDPDSRYLLGRDDCPWYPTATLLRQPAPGDWDAVVTRAVPALEAFRDQKAKR